MSKVALCVTFKASPGQHQALVERLKILAKTCLRHEPGCLQFDVLVPLDSSDGVLLYEVYENEAALKHHDQTPHFLAYRQETASMVAERVRVTAAVVSG